MDEGILLNSPEGCKSEQRTTTSEQVARVKINSEASGVETIIGLMKNYHKFHEILLKKPFVYK